MGAEATQDGRQVPHTPSHEVQAQLAERFSLTVSVSQINRVRATLGVSDPPQSAKKSDESERRAGVARGSGGLLLLAAAHETNLLSQWEEALPMKRASSSAPPPSPHQLLHPQRSLLLTLLFLPAVELHRCWDLHSFTGQELALLSGRTHHYSYRHTERLLLQLSSAQADQALTKALARWTTTLWQVKTRSQEA